MDPRFIVMAWSIFLVSVIVFFSRQIRLRLAETAFPLMFVVSPVLVFNTAQQLIYSADFVGAIAVVNVARNIFSGKSKKFLVGRIDYLVFFILCVSPVVTLIFQLIFNDDFLFLHTINYLGRSFFTFFIYVWLCDCLVISGS